MSRESNRKVILITGGTGSLGKALIHKLMNNDSYSKIIIYSRDEHKQETLFKGLQKCSGAEKLRFLIGDIRDYSRLSLAMQGVTEVIHTAALKIVPTIEYNPDEAIKTNILGAQNLISAARERQVEKVIAVSTDKAVSPLNLYGATKLAMEKLVIAANNINTQYGPRFSVVRYGNVSGSRGSVIPLFQKLLAEKRNLTITHKSMSRFWITLYEASDFVLNCLDTMEGNEIFIPEMKSYTVLELAQVMLESEYRNFGQPETIENRIEYVGIRPGEKLHEEIVSLHEMPYVVDIPNGGYIIGREVQKDYLDYLGDYPANAYTSEHNRMSKQELANKMIENGFIFPQILLNGNDLPGQEQVWG